MATVIENLISKNAADKDAKMMKEATDKINAAPAAAPAAGAAAKPAEAQPFDIGKFAGIFAAFGMALGALGTALTSIFGGILAMPWWKTLVVIAAILLVISGPAMIMAWMKLRRRNIAPLLNANGWAVNAASKISIPFGETLTDAAKYPKMKLKDPYAKAGMAPWKAWLITIAALAVVACGLWLFNLLSWAGLNSPLPRYNQTEVVAEEVVECCTDCETATDSTAVVEVVAE
jgi:MFS family permease